MFAILRNTYAEKLNMNFNGGIDMQVGFDFFIHAYRNNRQELIQYLGKGGNDALLASVNLLKIDLEAAETISSTLSGVDEASRLRFLTAKGLYGIQYVPQVAFILWLAANRNSEIAAKSLFQGALELECYSFAILVASYLVHC